MAIARRAVTGNKAEATGSDVVLTYPAGIVANDVMVLRWATTGTTITLNTPAGWTVVSGPIDKGTTNREYLLVRVANGTEAGNTLTLSASASSANKRFAQLAAYSGVDTGTPILASASFVETASGTTHAAPTVNIASVSGCWIVEFASDRGSPGSTSWTPPAGYTPILDTQVGTAAGTLTTGMADSQAAVSPSTTAGGGTWTGTVSTANSILWTVALQPPATSGSPTGLTATPITSSRIDLDWNDTAGATGYDVERNGVIIASPTASTYSDTGLSPNTLYSYRVRSTS